MSPPGSWLQIRWQGLQRAGKACADAVDELSPAVRAFQRDAAPTDKCFGFLEGGSSEELSKAYSDFYHGMIGHLNTKSSDLDSCGKMLEKSAGAYRDAEHGSQVS